MASLSQALKVLYGLEFSNRPDKFLHHNDGENGYTLAGIYQSANPKESFWKTVDDVVMKHDGDIIEASKELFENTNILMNVQRVYRDLYWNKIRGDEITSQKIAEEIFIMVVVSGIENGVKLAQGLVGANIDGDVGTQTITFLNNFNENNFDVKYDDLEIDFFEKLAIRKPHLAKNLKGWKNRAKAV